jgi:serine/threonine-protein kinase
VDTAKKQNPGKIERIGKYPILGILGVGGMGVVYRGMDQSVGREVAIKTLTEATEELRQRFLMEARSGVLNHPNIVTVYDFGEQDGLPYIVMEYLPGDSLENLLRKGHNFSLIEKLDTIRQLCLGLGYAHRKGVIHRDIKPANMMVQPDGMVKIVDFGVARVEERSGITQTGMVIGTFHYIAPERLLGKTADGRADIWSAGVILYLLLTGQLPFPGDDPATLQRVVREPYKPLSKSVSGYPAALDQVVERALAKSPDDRYATADEMAVDLTAVIAEIRQEEAQQLLPEARRLIEEQSFQRAQEVLQELLKIQTTHNTEAKALMKEVNHQLAQRRREEKIQQIRVQAESLLNARELDKSLAILEEGLAIDSANAELTKLRQRVRKEKEKQKNFNEFLQQADSARRLGDYQAAIAFVRKALKLDKSNTKGIQLFNLLLNEAEEAEKRARVTELLRSASVELNAKRYVEAIGFLRNAELLDPNNLELPLLLGDANAGLEQVRRGELIARLESEASSASGLEQLKQAAKAIREAMANMPSEGALVLLTGQVDRQIRELEDQRFVIETVQACRELRPRQALLLVQKARQRVPEDGQLLKLDGILSERVRQLTADERRDEYLSQASEALSAGQFADAVRSLEDCQQEGIATEKILSLLEFARREEAEYRRQELLRQRVIQSQSLIGDSAFGEAIELLEEALLQNDDPSLRLLLEQAIEGRESLRKEIESVLASAQRLARVGKVAEAIQLFQEQPPAVRRSIRVETAKSSLEDDQQQAAFRMIGRAYAALDAELSAGASTIRWVVAAIGDSPLSGSIADAFQKRTQAFADRTILDLISKCKVMLRSRDRAGIGDLIDRASTVIEYAGPQMKSNWQSILNQTRKTGVFRTANKSGKFT